MKRLIELLVIVLALSAPALAASGPAPADFVGVRLGSDVAELRRRYQGARLNPDSDSDFVVYQVASLSGEAVQSPAAFNFYHGHLIGGQVLLTTATAEYWLNKLKHQYGEPDTCTYCESPDIASAKWHWPNGTAIAIEGGGMVNFFTAEGLADRQAWIARGESGARRPAPNEQAQRGSATAVASSGKANKPPAEITWHSLYRSAMRRIKGLFGAR